jgi:hypothetical protein
MGEFEIILFIFQTTSNRRLDIFMGDQSDLPCLQYKALEIRFSFEVVRLFLCAPPPRCQQTL